MQFKYEEAVGQYLRQYGLQFWDYPKEDMFDKRMEAAAVFEHNGNSRGAEGSLLTNEEG